MGSCLLLLAPIFFAFAVASPLSDVRTPPVWSQSYHVMGVLHIPYAEIDEPFNSWYDASLKMSRIDYYEGMVKTYQLANSGFGVSLKIAPFTTEEVQNAVTCFQVDGTREDSIETQAILPSLDGFVFAGTEIIHGIKAEKWNSTQIIGEKENRYTMYIRYKHDPKDKTNKIAVPLRYEMRGYNTLLGSHYDHYYLDYDYFKENEVISEVFQLEPDMKCRSFPGPGNKHIYTFNPMAEFIRPETSHHVDSEFHEFVDRHGKQYADKREHALRKEIFRQNVRFIHSFNRQNKGYTLAINHLSDKTEVELKALRGKTYSGEYNGGQPFPYKNIDANSLPDQFDWRIYGAVTPVKDQSVCGSCWSFGTVGAVEGAFFLKNGGELVRLSEQALLDCSWGYGNNGCDGGEDFRSYQWMLKHGGIPTDEEYGSYLGADGYCHADKVQKVAKITGWVNVTSGDPNALKLALLKHGPISVAIDASHRSFSFYSNGVYYDPECGNKDEDLDHAVLVVGYGSIDGQEYWLVKNSWSNYWGNDGYILMAIKDNNCGVMTMPTYVTM